MHVALVEVVAEPLVEGLEHAPHRLVVAPEPVRRAAAAQHVSAGEPLVLVDRRAGAVRPARGGAARAPEEQRLVEAVRVAPLAEVLGVGKPPLRRVGDGELEGRRALLAALADAAARDERQ